MSEKVDKGPLRRLWLDELPAGTSLITQEQAHRLMSLASERAGLSHEWFEGEERAQELERIQADIHRIWTEVFGEPR